MSEKPHIMAVKVIAVLLTITLLITIMLLVPKFARESVQASEQLEYVEKVFDKSIVNEISIDMDETDFQWLMENAINEEYKSCNITINGEKFYNVGIRPKGNSSLSNLAMSGETKRFSFKIDFDQYLDGQTYYGMESLVLNNIMSDKSYMKEYLSYELFDFMDIPSSDYAYSNIKINNEDWGLYLAVELVDESFIQRNFGTLEGNLYKPEGMDMGGGGFGKQNGGGRPEFGNFNSGEMPIPKGNDGAQRLDRSGVPSIGMPYQNDQSDKNSKQKKNIQNNQNTEDDQNNSKNLENQKGEMMNGGFRGMMSEGTNLKYTDDNPESYSVIREGAIFKTTTDADFEKVIKMIKNLNEGTELEKYLDVDEILRFWAVNTFLVNLDSYAGGMYHNYYLYEKDGVFTLLPWDFNMSFAGFGMTSASSAINFPIDKPVTGNLEDAPLIGKFLEIDEYKTLYHSYLKKIVEEYLGRGIYENSVSSVNTLISDYVKNDATAFYTFEDYQKAISAMITFGKDRAASIAAQLDGTQSSVDYGTMSTTLNLDDLGSMNFGGFGGKGKTETSQGQQGDTTKKGSMQMPSDMQRRGDNMQPPSGMQQGDIPQLENIQEVMKIMNEANGKELTYEQEKKLEYLGVDENMLVQMQKMSQRRGFPGGENLSNNSEIMKVQIVILFILIVFLIVGMAFVARFRRKTYVICK